MAWVLLVACGKGAPRDECTTVKDKVRPLIQGMMRDAGKPISDAKLEELLGEFCVPGEDRTLYDCVLKASDQAATATCLQSAFAEYAGATKRPPSRPDAAEPDAYVYTPPPIDAEPRPPVVAPGSTIPAIDPATLPVIEVPAVTGRGPETEVLAVDADADRLLVELATESLLMTPIDKRITGTFVAPNQTAAFSAVAKALGVESKPPMLKGKGVTITLRFARAPVEDLLRLFADVGRRNIVAPAGLGKVDIVVARAPWEAVLAAVAQHAGLEVKPAGATTYLVARGAQLPALRSGLSKRVSVHARSATVAEVLAAVRAVTPVPALGPCDVQVSFHLRGAPVAEVLRALEVLVKEPLVEATCPESTRPPHAIAALGTSSAFLPLDVPASPDSFAGYLARMQRVQMLLRKGTEWMAYIQHADGVYVMPNDPSHVYLHTYDSSQQPVIDRTGITFIDDYGRVVKLPLGR